MFYLGRVLPPPAPSSSHRTPSSPEHHATRDGRQPYRIMTIEKDTEALGSDSNARKKRSAQSAVINEVEHPEPDGGNRGRKLERSVTSRNPSQFSISSASGDASIRDPESETLQRDKSEPSDTSPSVRARNIKSKPSDTPRVCLCQPEPKIPRPRNAFILFRQHFQSEVTKKNPGLPNPEISKVIGEYWRKAPQEVKDKWKALAENEKAQHSQRYPNYRYKPRRGNQASSEDSDTASKICPKCGGVSMSARLPTPMGGPPLPQTPLDARANPPTPNAVPFSRYGHAASPSYFQGHETYSREPRRAYEMYPPRHRDSGYGSLPYIYAKGEDIELPRMSPEHKRRRYNSTYLPGATRAGSIANAIYAPLGPTSGYARHRGYDRDTREQRQSHSDIKGPLVIDAAPRPIKTPANTRQPDKKVTLAPLKTQNAATTEPRANSYSHSVEAMISGIPPLNKIRVLSKVSPPLRPPSVASPPHVTRGAIVAVEGKDESAVKTIVSYLNALLQKDDEHQIKLFHSDKFPAKLRDASNNNQGAVHHEGYIEWLKYLIAWHRESQVIQNFITSAAEVSPNISPGTVPGTQMVTRSHAHSRSISTSSDSPSQAKDSGPSSNKEPDTMDAVEDDNNSSIQVAKQQQQHSSKKAMPVAILPCYQLSLTDLAAACVPITDEYSPTDHWQWMATLWRGIIGPDVTVIVQTARELGTGAAVAGSEAGAGGGNGQVHPPPSKEEWKSLELVDVRLADFRTIVLRCEKEGEVPEAGLRRLGFEVSECLRSMRESEGRRASVGRG